MRLTPLLAAAALLAAASPLAAQTPPAASGLVNPRAGPPELVEDAALAAAIASPTRTEAERTRDAARHPYESMTFWGLRPGLTVVEFEPGGGWWRHILEPYAQATGGRYVAADDLAALQALPEGGADMVLVARAIHGWARQPGETDAHMTAIARALKPGGVLAVEQHRAEEGLNAAETASSGYVSESYVIQAAQRAGLALDARSELNANPNDDHDHAFGVWTLPPTRSSRNRDGSRVLTDAERAEYDAVGESDRMTLRLRKAESAGDGQP